MERFKAEKIRKEMVSFPWGMEGVSIRDKNCVNSSVAGNDLLKIYKKLNKHKKKR
jgi:hypothetical protein